MEKRSDNDIRNMGMVFIIFSALFIVLLTLRPLGDASLENISGLGALTAFIIAFIFSFRLIKLYGWKSTEGRFWVSILLMILIILTGIIVSELVSDGVLSFRIYSVFSFIAFLVFIAGVMDKLKTAGVKPGLRDYGLAVAGIVVTLILTSLFMMTLSGQSNSESGYAKYHIDILVVLESYVLIFMCLLMAKLMGGHISKGWFFLGAGASLNSLSFSFYSALVVVGGYYPGHYVDAISIAAINTVAFSAYYQYKKHMELISSLI